MLRGILTTSLITLLICLANAAEEEKSNVGFHKIQDVLEKFVELVEKHKLNVSIVMSNVDHWWNGNVQSVDDVAIHLPTNEEHLLETTLTTKAQEEWRETVEDLKNPMVVGAWHRYYKPNDAELTNDPSEVVGPNTPSYKRIVNNVNGKQRFEVDEYNVETEYNFKLEHDKEHSRAVVYGANATVFVLKSKGIKRRDIEKIESLARKYYFFYEESEHIATKLSDDLDAMLPDGNWQVIVNIDDAAISSPKYAILEVFRERKVLIFDQ